MPRNSPSSIPDDLRADLAAYLTPEPMGPFVSNFIAGLSRDKQRTVPFLIALNRATAKQGPLSDPHGAGRADAGRNAGARVRFLPRLGVAAGSDRAQSRSRRALRLRLSDSAQGRCRSARRPEGHRQGFLRSARLGRSLSSGRGLDRIRRHLGHADRRGAYSGRRHAALSFGRAHRRQCQRGEHAIFIRHAGRPHSRSAARHQAVFRRDLGEARYAGRRRRPRSGDAGCPPDHGRRADLRFRRRS